MDYFDLHCDTITRCFDEGLSLEDGAQEISLHKARPLKRYCQLFAIFVPDTLSEETALAKYQAYIAHFRAEMQRYAPKIAQVCTNQELDAVLQSNRRAAILTVENASVLNGDLSNIGQLAADGVKVVTLTWNGENSLGYGSAIGGPLKSFGRDAVAELHRRGIVIDVSHLSDEGFDDVLELAENGVVATHSNLRAICDHPRNLTDAQFSALVERGGRVGLNLHRPFLSVDENATATPEAIFRHIDRMLELGGENAICIGSDFDGAKMPVFCRDLGTIPVLYQSCSARYGVALAKKIFYDNAKSYFDRMLSAQENFCDNNITV